jgi:hypothetical protein
LGYYAGIQVLIGTTNLEQTYEYVKLFIGNYCANVLIKETKPDLTPALQSLKLSSLPRIQMNPEFDQNDCQGGNILVEYIYQKHLSGMFKSVVIIIFV